MDKLIIHGGAPLAGEVARLRREERRAADPLRVAADARAAARRQRAASARRHARCARCSGRWASRSTSTRSSALDAARRDDRLAARALRAREDDARVDARARAAARALRRSARVAAGRLRDRLAARRPARQGPAGDGREIDLEHGYMIARARRGCTGARIVLRPRHRHRHREPDDGGDARRRHDDHSRTPRASPKSSISRAASTRWARRSAAPAATCIRIEGVERLHGADAPRHARPHRDRAPSSPPRRRRGGDVTLTGARADTLDAVLDKLRECGATIESGGDWIARRGANGRLDAVERAHRAVSRLSRPTCRRSSWRCNASPRAPRVITETIFENRFMHVQELKRLGADIEVEGNTAVVQGRAAPDGAT